MKYILIFWFQFFLLLSVEAQGVAYSVEIPYENIKGKIIIPATVNGVAGRYIFDTGAPMCLTHTRVMRDKQALSVTKATDANGQKKEFRSLNLKEVQLAGLKYTDIEAIVFEEGNLLECYGVDGIVGSNLFGASVIRIDSRRRLLTISANAVAYGIPARNSVAMTVNDQGTPLFRISPGMGIQESVMFDSGSGSFLSLTSTLSNKLEAEGCVEVVARGFGALSWSVGGVEKADEKQRVRVADLRVGVGKFRNVTTVTMNGPISRIGARLLEYGIVTIDYPGGKFSFEPFSSAPADMAKKYWNTDLTLQGDRIIVGCVWNEMREQLKGGETVVEINGKPTGRYEPCQVMTSEVFKMEGDEATVVVVDAAGKEQKIVIRKQ